MADLVDQAVEIFNIRDDDLRGGAALALSGLVAEATKLCVNFEGSARSEGYKKQCRAGHEDLAQHSRAIERVCGRPQPWAEAEYGALEQGFDGYFRALQHLMNLSESEVAEAILRNLGLMVTATTDIRDKLGRYQLEGLVANVDTVSAVVVKTLKNRVTVTQDPAAAAVLSRTVELLEGNLPRIKSLSASRSQEQERMQLCDEVIRSVQEASAVVSQSVVTHASFAPPKDVQKFGTVRQKEQLAKETAEKVNLAEWSVDKVCELFESLGATEAERLRLRDEGVDGAALALLSNEELGSELGLKLGVRKKFANWLVHIQQQNEKPAATAAAAAAPPVRQEPTIVAPASRVSQTAAAPRPAAAPAPSKPRPGPAVRPSGMTHKPRGVSTIRRMSAQVDAELESMLAGLDDI